MSPTQKADCSFYRRQGLYKKAKRFFVGTGVPDGPSYRLGSPLADIPCNGFIRRGESRIARRITVGAKPTGNMAKTA